MLSVALCHAWRYNLSTLSYPEFPDSFFLIVGEGVFFVVAYTDFGSEPCVNALTNAIAPPYGDNFFGC